MPQVRRRPRRRSEIGSTQEDLRPNRPQFTSTATGTRRSSRRAAPGTPQLSLDESLLTMGNAAYTAEGRPARHRARRGVRVRRSSSGHGSESDGAAPDDEEEDDDDDEGEDNGDDDRDDDSDDEGGVVERDRDRDEGEGEDNGDEGGVVEGDAAGDEGEEGAEEEEEEVVQKEGDAPLPAENDEEEEEEEEAEEVDVAEAEEAVAPEDPPAPAPDEADVHHPAPDAAEEPDEDGRPGVAPLPVPPQLAKKKKKKVKKRKPGPIWLLQRDLELLEGTSVENMSNERKHTLAIMQHMMRQKHTIPCVARGSRAMWGVEGWRSLAPFRRLLDDIVRNGCDLRGVDLDVLAHALAVDPFLDQVTFDGRKDAVDTDSVRFSPLAVETLRDCAEDFLTDLLAKAQSMDPDGVFTVVMLRCGPPCDEPQRPPPCAGSRLIDLLGEIEALSGCRERAMRHKSRFNHRDGDDRPSDPNIVRYNLLHAVKRAKLVSALKEATKLPDGSPGLDVSQDGKARSTWFRKARELVPIEERATETNMLKQEPFHSLFEDFVFRVADRESMCFDDGTTRPPTHQEVAFFKDRCGHPYNGSRRPQGHSEMAQGALAFQDALQHGLAKEKDVIPLDFFMFRPQADLPDGPSWEAARRDEKAWKTSEEVVQDDLPEPDAELLAAIEQRYPLHECDDDDPDLSLSHRRAHVRYEAAMRRSATAMNDMDRWRKHRQMEKLLQRKPKRKQKTPRRRELLQKFAAGPRDVPRLQVRRRLRRCRFALVGDEKKQKELTQRMVKRDQARKEAVRKAKRAAAQQRAAVNKAAAKHKAASPRRRSKKKAAKKKKGKAKAKKKAASPRRKSSAKKKKKGQAKSSPRRKSSAKAKKTKPKPTGKSKAKKPTGKSKPKPKPKPTRRSRKRTLSQSSSPAPRQRKQRRVAGRETSPASSTAVSSEQSQDAGDESQSST